MGFVGSIFSDDKGAGFQAQSADVTSPTNPEAIAASQKAANDALLAQQGSFGNQQAVISQQQDFLNQINAQNGLGNQSSVFNQLQGVANGTGPNPAQAQLAQASGANVANQAALMAGQRGSGANVGLLARQAAMQGGNIQQNAAGQAATMQANQSLGALNQLGGLANTQVNNQLGAQQALGASTQGLSNAKNAYASNALANQAQQYGAQQGVNAQNVAMQSNINNANAGIAQQNASTQGDIFRGAVSGAANGAQAMGAAEGGLVPSHEPKSSVGRHLGGYKPMYADGGDISLFGGPAVANADLYRSGVIHNSQPSSSPGAAKKEASVAPMDSPSVGESYRMMAAKGGKVSVLVSPGERYLSPKEVDKVANGEKSPMKAGEKIPGKPLVGGAKNDYANDTVHKKLQEGGIVLPRSVTQSKDPDKAAIAFIAAVMAKHGKKGLK